MVSPQSLERERIDAEAAAWLYRLQEDGRAPETEQGFQAWLRENPEHELAFAAFVDLWDILPGAATVQRTRVANDTGRARGFPNLKVAAAASVVLGVAAGGLMAWSHRVQIFETAPGQQYVTTLADGSRVSLNTDSKITVRYSPGVRNVELMRGEALFDVAHNASRPFLVRADEEQVRAVGTSFVVRRAENEVSVTLIKGSVELSEAPEFLPQTILAPGERAVVDNAGHVSVDRPAIDNITAWRQGEVVFDDTTLLEASNEFNRYGGIKIRISDPAAARQRVSGVFETNNPVEFASVVAKLKGLTLRRNAEVIELSSR